MLILSLLGLHINHFQKNRLMTAMKLNSTVTKSNLKLISITKEIKDG